MNRNNEIFATMPSLDNMQRSKFTRNFSHHTSFNSGRLIPFYVDEVLAGDTFDIKLASTVRMSTPIVPVMDDCFLDTYFFYVPSRLCWNRFKEFIGENARSNWNSAFDERDIVLPKIAFNKQSEQPKNENGYFQSNPDNVTFPHTLEHSLVDYFGLPYLNFQDLRGASSTEQLDFSKTNTFNMLPFEAYNLIWNNFFRDKNYCDPCPLMLQETKATDDEAVSGVYYETNMYSKNISDSPYVDSLQYLAVKPVSKFHDYFTSMLPNAQRGEPVVLPGFNDDESIVPVVTVGNDWDNEIANSFGEIGLRFRTKSNARVDTPLDLFVNGDGSGTLDGTTSSSSALGNNLKPSNLGLSLSNISKYDSRTLSMQPFLPTINDLRNAFAIQRLLEKDALGGSMYSEILYSHFGVLNPDSRVQLPEYLGGDRININMEQVIQTSESGVTPQGNASGFSLTNSVGSSFVKSFTEPGYVIGVCCVRPQHSYQNGIERMWTRTERFDFYYPALAHIGEQPVMKNEIVATPLINDHAIGYQEAWAEYRYKPSIVSSNMRTGLDDSLDIWHYADAFNVPNGIEYNAFDIEFMLENPDLIDRTLAVSSDLEPQFFGDFYVSCDSVRPMPIFSVPGLVDHH